jgi:hypothetical protein
VEGIAEQLILQLARLWADDPAHQDVKLRLTIVGAAAPAELADLRARYPALDHYLDLNVRPLAIQSAAFQAGAVMSEPGAACDVTRAYVTLADEAAGLLAALALHARADAVAVPVTVVVTDARAGVSAALGSERGRFGGIESFGVLSEATHSTLLLRGTNELLARAQHAQWLRAQRSAGTGTGNPNFHPWDELDESARERNRRFADDVHTKLDLVHCMLVPMPLPAPDEPPFQFNPDELETLSRQEHIRWMNTMLATGWTYGAKRDDAHKVHDQIKPWEDLDELNRDKDRDAVREIPRMLADAGFAIRRSTTAGTPSD